MATTTRETYDGNGNLIKTEQVPISDEQVNADALKARLQQARQANNAYLALANPTAAQKDAQLTRATKALNALIAAFYSLLSDITDSA